MKYVTTCLLILCLVFTSFLPIFARPAKAQFGGIVFDPAHNASTLAQTALTFADMAARVGAQAVLQSMINSTANWAKSGFRGKPAYAVNSKQYFTDIADGVAGTFIAGSDLGFLCSPFQAQIRLALKNEYAPPIQFQCTLTQVTGNIEAFYSDFSQGGWEAWFEMTQNNSNNPYGAYLDAQVELDARIANAIGIESQQLDWGSGFLSFKNCLATNPPATVNTPAGQAPNPAHVPGVAVGDCVQEGPVKTPGVVIAEQLNNVLPANMERFINAQHLEDLIAAFVTGALNRYVFGPAGLF